MGAKLMQIKLTDKECDALTYWLEYAESAMAENIAFMVDVDNEYSNEEELKDEKKRQQAILRVMKKMGLKV
jgi:hypothetical protein